MWPCRTGERAFPALSFPCPISYAQTGSGIIPYPVRSGQAAFEQVGFLPPGTFLIVRQSPASLLARLGIADHIADNGQVFGLALDADDLALIEAVLSKSRDLMRLIGRVSLTAGYAVPAFNSAAGRPSC